MLWGLPLGQKKVVNYCGRVLTWNPTNTFESLGNIGIFDGFESVENIEKICSVIQPMMLHLQNINHIVDEKHVNVEVWGGCDMKMLSLLLGLRGDFRGTYCCPW
jgi:hypothetical protein